MRVTAGLAGFGWVGGAWSTLRAAGNTLQHRLWLLSVEGEDRIDMSAEGRDWFLCSGVKWTFCILPNKFQTKHTVSEYRD